MISAWEIWLIGQATNIGIGFTVFAGIFGYFGIMFVLEKMRYGKLMLCVAFISAFIAIFTPTSKTVAAMFLIPAIVNNEQVQNISHNSLKLLESLTEEWAEELRPDKVNE